MKYPRKFIHSIMAVLMIILALVAGVQPVNANPGITPSSCDGSEVTVAIGYSNDSSYDQSAEVSVGDSVLTSIILPPGGSIERFPLGVSSTTGGEMYLSISNAHNPLDGIQVIRLVFGAANCNRVNPPSTSLTSTTFPVNVVTTTSMITPGDTYVNPPIADASPAPTKVGMPLSMAG